MENITVEEAQTARLEHARKKYAHVINLAVAAVREKASSGAGRVEVWLEDDDAEAAQYAAEYLRARGFDARVIDMDEGELVGSWVELHVEWGATPQWP